MRRVRFLAAIVVLSMLGTGAREDPSAADGPRSCLGESATIVGTSGPDVLTGTPGPDVIAGSDGDDVLDGRGGDDLLCGGAGEDGLVGSAGADVLEGGPGADVLNGGFGDDVLLGRLGIDTCLQGPGEGREASCERFDLQPGFPVLATFYYPWFPEVWSQEGIYPFTNYSPSLGLYDSADPSVIHAHIEAMVHGGIQVGISSWWGQRDFTDERVRLLLRGAVDTAFRWTVYYEDEGYGDPTVAQIRSDLSYIRSRYASHQSFLRIDGRFVVFVFSADDTRCHVVDRWARANTVGAHLVFEAFPGYLDCPIQPDGWHLYGAASPDAGLLPHAYTITPGFWKAGEDPFFERDLDRWLQSVADMRSSGARWQLVTSFNEWGEGTSVESAIEWESDSGFGTYLDALSPSTPDPPPNIALGKPATASGSYQTSVPSGAVDGDPERIWNSGGSAPQWIEIDLGSPRAIGRISLLAAQSPAGETVHRVLGRADAGDPYRPLHEFAGFTKDGQSLDHAPPSPWTDVRFIRVETTLSPSWVAWREIRVYPAAAS